MWSSKTNSENNKICQNNETTRIFHNRAQNKTLKSLYQSIVLLEQLKGIFGTLQLNSQTKRSPEEPILCFNMWVWFDCLIITEQSNYTHIK